MAKKLSLFEKIMHTMDYLADGIADVVRTGKFSDKLLSFDTEQARNNYNVYKSSWNTQREEKESKSESKIKAVNKVPVKEEGKGIEEFFKKAVYTLFFKAGEEKEKREIRTKIEVLRKMKIINEYKNGTSKENETSKDNEAPQVEAPQNEAAKVEALQEMTNEYKFSNRNAELNKIANSLQDVPKEEAEVTQDVESNNIANPEPEHKSSFYLVNSELHKIANPEPEHKSPFHLINAELHKIANSEQLEKTAPNKEYTESEKWVISQGITNPKEIEELGKKTDKQIEGLQKEIANFMQNSSANNKSQTLENNKSNERGAVGQVEIEM